MTTQAGKREAARSTSKGWCGVALGALAFGCGAAERHSHEISASSAVPKADYGFLAVEAIEEDGSQKGVGVDPQLVEHMDEVTNALPMLEQAEVSLAFMLQAHKLRDPAAMDEVFSLVEEAQRRGITVVPVPVISADDGYFPNATNFEVFVPVVRELVGQWKARGLAATTLYVDMEPPRELAAALSSLELSKAVPRDHIDRNRYARAVRAYSALVDELHGKGFRVAITTQATLLADYDDGDDDLRQYFNVVIDGPRWDQIDFQLYRSAYTGQVPGLDASFVYTFAKKALAQFPDTRVGVGLGLTHPGPIFPDTPTYKSSKSLREDVQAALAAGLSREQITVYNLKGVLVGPPVCDKLTRCDPEDYHYPANDPARWFVRAEDAKPLERSVSTAALAEQFALMDGLLDMSEGSQSDGLLGR
ncbi:MAG TPA: hypothetical protein VI299_05790 [Polyangiales bacterium]